MDGERKIQETKELMGLNLIDDDAWRQKDKHGIRRLGRLGDVRTVRKRTMGDKVL